MKRMADDKMPTPDASGGRRRPIKPEEQSLLQRCREAFVLEVAGDYESALRVLSKWWARWDERPFTQGMHPLAAAELLLRAGAINARLASAKQAKGGQALAKELLTESLCLFEQEKQKGKAAEARAELGQCSWREGDFEGAWQWLRPALAVMSGGTEACHARLVALLRAAVVNLDSGRPDAAFNLLTESASLFLSSDSETLKGRYHINLGIVYKELAQETNHKHFLVRAVSEQKAAIYHLNRANAKRLIAHAENNLGFALFLLDEFERAAERLSRALKLFTELGDAGYAAQVKETQAQLLLAQGRCDEAARLAAEVARTLEAGARPALLAEALTTMGKSLAGDGRFDAARAALERATEVAEEAGAWETAGLAALTGFEELNERIEFVEGRRLYQHASSLLAGAHHYGTRLRLQRAADKIIAATHKWALSAVRPSNPATESTAPEARSLRAVLVKLSGCQSTLLITGKRAADRLLLARIAHERSGRAGEPFVVADCAAHNKKLASHEFLSGDARRAAGGTLVLDEVQVLSRNVQGQVLRLIREGVVEHGRAERRCARVAVRVIACTSCDLSKEVARGLFSPELFERLGGHSPLSTPSAEALEEARVIEGCRAKEEVRCCYPKRTKLPKAAAHVLRAPVTNVVGLLARNHSHTLAAAGAQGDFVRAPNRVLATSSIDRAVEDGAGQCIPLKEAVGLFEMEYIREALEAAGGSITKAAENLRMPRQTLQNKIETKHTVLQEVRTPLVKRGRRTDATAHTKKSRTDAAA